MSGEHQFRKRERIIYGMEIAKTIRSPDSGRKKDKSTHLPSAYKSQK